MHTAHRRMYDWKYCAPFPFSFHHISTNKEIRVLKNSTCISLSIKERCDKCQMEPSVPSFQFSLYVGFSIRRFPNPKLTNLNTGNPRWGSVAKRKQVLSLPHKLIHGIFLDLDPFGNTLDDIIENGYYPVSAKQRGNTRPRRRWNSPHDGRKMIWQDNVCSGIIMLLVAYDRMI